MHRKYVSICADVWRILSSHHLDVASMLQVMSRTLLLGFSLETPHTLSNQPSGAYYMGLKKN